MKIFSTVALLFATVLSLHAQEVLETGGRTMPNEWIDKDTKHRIVKLTRMEGRSNLSFYFHNNPFIGNSMVFYSSNKNNVDSVRKQEISTVVSGNRQIHLLDLKTLKSEQLTYHRLPMNGEIVDNKKGIVYYQIRDTVFSVNTKTKEVKTVFVFPGDFK